MKKHLIPRLMTYIKPHFHMVIGSVIFNIFGIVLSLCVPPLIGKIIDLLIKIGAVDLSALLNLSLLLAACVALSAIFQLLGLALSNKLSFIVVKDLRDNLDKKLNNLPISFFDNTPHGEVVARITADCDAVGDGLIQALQQFICGSVTIIATIIFMFVLSPFMAIVVLCISPIPAFVAWLIAHSCQKSFASMQKIQGELAGYVEETYSISKLIRTFSKGQDHIDKFNKINSSLYTAGEHAQFVGSLTNPGTRLANNIVYAVVAIVGCLSAFGALPGALTIGGVQSFLSYTNQYTKPFNEISDCATQLQTALASLSRIFDMLDLKEIEEVSENVQLSQPSCGQIDFNHVDFDYTSEKPLLRDIDFHVRPGERIALVGTTGCGKTTLINLLLRFYDPIAGTIKLDGVDISTVKRQDLRRSFGMVLQDTWLTCGTVAENIAFGCADATRERIISVAKDALAHNFIMQLEFGYDTLIGEGGASLSQGQEQLLSIARCMLSNPSVLVLDEATSSIDTVTEKSVQEAFLRMMEGRTSIVVAHRLSTIQTSDKILVMDSGRIVESGNHDELLQLNGRYAELIRAAKG